MAEDLKVLLLHGNLDIFVKDAKNLPNMDMFDTTVKTMFWRKGNKTSDPYVSIVLAGAVVGRTFVIPDDENPSWMQHFNVPVAHYAKELHFLVKDDDVLGSEIIGTVAIPVEHLCMGSKLEDTFPVLNSSGKPCKRGAVLTLSIQYLPMERMTIYPRGVGSDPEHSGVPGTYFPLRKCCKVTLYQDAHVHDSLLPNLELDGGFQYKHRSCWSDIFEAISQAQRLVYLVGWSIYHNLRLVREGKAGGAILGDLLKAKSQEGVRVLLLIWDDPTSTSIFGYKSEGVMQTNDEETRRFFKHSSVQVLLCPRASKKGSFMKNQEAGKIYTHHQKTVIVDADAGTGDYRRHIVAFIGGLDLCTGRYDTQEHSLFGTLQTVHKDDYHNPNFVEIAEGGPREAWHDLHSRIDGPAAYDILTNFQERWVKAAKAGIQRLKSAFEDTLVRIERIPAIIGIAEFSSIRKDKDDPESWHVQIFRSIDSNSVKGFPKQPKDASSRNLVCGKNVLIDTGIHTAYVKAIRSAQHFIYIENQYFLGSSYNWDAHQDLGADNLIPVEIALKIASKIRSNERFVAYILIPMWPEGIPTSMTTQRILYWQNKTMQMMYDTIYKALVEAGVEDKYKPQDFLMFFCLGNREAVSEGEDASNSKAASAPQASSQKNRRFMIYVHSKGMIADDEYVILGSANINQRSMEGTRDTEIAMGAYQIGHTWAGKDGHPRGQVYGYRMSLWAEHLGGVEECFKHPQSLECARRVKLLSELNWEQYVADQVTDMKGHLMKYPVQVDDTGKVSSLPGYDKFPDLGGLIVGTFSVIQENLTI